MNPKGISLVVYGTSIASLKKFGFEQIDIGCDEVVKRTPKKEGGIFVPCEIIPAILEEECDKLFAQAPDHWEQKKEI